MNGLSVPATGLAPWHAAATAPLLGSPRLISLGAAAACICAVLTVASAAAVWWVTAPATVVQTRIVADGPTGMAGRRALAQAAMLFATASEHDVALEDGGEALAVTVQDADSAAAHRRVHALVNTILMTPVAAEPSVVTVPPDPRLALLAERARLAALADGMAAQSATTSVSLTALVRDMAAVMRVAAERIPSRVATLEKGAAALADLQIERFQLTAKYQADFPAIGVLDGHIRRLKAFLIAEGRRPDAPRPAQADPAETMLASERDRLRIEMAQVDDHRRALTAQVATLDARLAAIPDLPAAALAPAAPVLIQAATTEAYGADDRLLTVPAIAAAGLVLTCLSFLLLRRWAIPLIAPGDMRAGQSGIGMLGGPSAADLEDSGLVLLHYPAQDKARGRYPDGRYSRS